MAIVILRFSCSPIVQTSSTALRSRLIHSTRRPGRFRYLMITGATSQSPVTNDLQIRLHALRTIPVRYFAPGRDVKYCDWTVRMSVCSHVSEATCPNSRNFLYLLPVMPRWLAFLPTMSQVRTSRFCGRRHVTIFISLNVFSHFGIQGNSCIYAFTAGIGCRGWWPAACSIKAGTKSAVSDCLIGGCEY